MQIVVSRLTAQLLSMIPRGPPDRLDESISENGLDEVMAEVPKYTGERTVHAETIITTTAVCLLTFDKRPIVAVYATSDVQNKKNLKI